MNTYLMKKAMIESVVDQGLKRIEDDPKRSIRRLADLGKQFSRSRFQEMLFSIMQELLDNEDSAYYEMVENLLRNADHDAMKTFGINVGYVSWTYGASKIRENESRLGCCIPWTILLRYDPSCGDGVNTEHMARLFQEGQDLGLYTWFIRERANTVDSYELLDLLERYTEGSFVWMKETGRLTAAQVQMLRLCENTIVSLPIDDSETFLTAALLREQKIPFALHREYDSDEFSQGSGGRSDEWNRFMDNVLTSQTALVFLIQKDGADFSAGDIAYQSRMSQKNPFVVVDHYADCTRISRILCEHPYLMELDEHGCLISPDGHKGEPFPFDLPLEQAFRRLMPAFPADE